jgi:hypothetical protein
MSATTKLAGFMALMLLLGFGLGYIFTALGVLPTNLQPLPDEVKAYASKVTVQVEQTQQQISFSFSSPMLRVLYWQVGGQMLTITRPNIFWQVDLGQEDFPTSDLKGDSLDVILKMAKLESPKEILFTVVCTGAFSKKVYYDTQLKLDYVEGQRASASWTVPYS